MRSGLKPMNNTNLANYNVIQVGSSKYGLVLTNMRVPKYRIIALKSFTSPLGFVKAGELGGFVESERNLDKEDNSWIYEDSYATHKSKVLGNSALRGASISGRVVVDRSILDGEITVFGKVQIYNSKLISDNLRFQGSSKLTNVIVRGRVVVDMRGESELTNVIICSKFFGRTKVKLNDNARVVNSEISGILTADTRCEVLSSVITHKLNLQGSAKIVNYKG